MSTAATTRQASRATVADQLAEIHARQDGCMAAIVQRCDPDEHDDVLAELAALMSWTQAVSNIHWRAIGITNGPMLTSQPSHQAAASTAFGAQAAIMQAINLRMNGGSCPTSGSFGECAAITQHHSVGSQAPFYTASLYLHPAAKDLTPKEVAQWFEEAGCTDATVHAVLHDPGNNIFDGASIDDGVRPWDVSFFLGKLEGGAA